MEEKTEEEKYNVLKSIFSFSFNHKIKYENGLTILKWFYNIIILLLLLLLLFIYVFCLFCFFLF